MPQDPVIHHLEMALMTGRETSSRAFGGFVERAIELYRSARGGSPTPLGALARWQRERAESMLIAGLERGVCLDDIAAACSLSRGHFARAFKKTTGLTPGRWLSSLRVEHAKRLLRESDATLSEIAAATGFADQSHLARAFKRATNSTPSDYRLGKR